MRQPSTPSGNNANARGRTRGAIRTHLGRKRSGARTRPLKTETLLSIERLSDAARQQQEDLFDRLLSRFQQLFAVAGEKSASAFDEALESACESLVSAGEFTAENAERLRQFLRRDLLQRDHPGMIFRTGDITSAGTLACAGCGWSLQTTRSTMLPACPRCSETGFRKVG
ncbi:MAG TPA: hypothetical protein VN878_06090 [Usitatibacter sp.]|nr:hypothetical protein [Usitatibacter sp.]